MRTELRSKILVLIALTFVFFTLIESYNANLPTLPIEQIVDTWYSDSPKQIFSIKNQTLTLLYPKSFFASIIKADYIIAGNLTTNNSQMYKDINIIYINSSGDAYLLKTNNKNYTINDLVYLGNYIPNYVFVVNDSNLPDNDNNGIKEYWKVPPYKIAPSLSRFVESLCVGLESEGGFIKGTIGSCNPNINNCSLVYTCKDVLYGFFLEDLGISSKNLTDSDKDGLLDLNGYIAATDNGESLKNWFQYNADGSISSTNSITVNRYGRLDPDKEIKMSAGPKEKYIFIKKFKILPGYTGYINISINIGQYTSEFGYNSGIDPTCSNGYSKLCYKVGPENYEYKCIDLWATKTPVNVGPYNVTAYIENGHFTVKFEGYGGESYDYLSGSCKNVGISTSIDDFTIEVTRGILYSKENRMIEIGMGSNSFLIPQ